MKFVDEAYDKMMKNVVVRKPIIKILKTQHYVTFKYDNLIKFTNVDDIDSLLYDSILYNTRSNLNLEHKRYDISCAKDYVKRDVTNRLENSILSWMKSHGGYANNTLSVIYKWYKEKLRLALNDETVAQDIFNVVKFLHKADQKTVDTGRLDDYKVVRTLLSLIKDRNESKFGPMPAPVKKAPASRWGRRGRRY